MSKKYTLPQYVEWQITAKCNLNCIHCSAVQRDSGFDLSTLAATELVHELLDAQIKSITISGGEPLLRNDWELLIGILKENDISVQIISNGQSLEEDTARKINRLGVNFVWLSLDGPEQAHNTVRRSPHAFARVMSAASQLERMEVPYGFMTTLLTTNYNQLPKLSEVVQKTSSALWQIWLGNKTNRAPIWLKPAQIQQVIAQLPQLRARTPQLIIGDNIGYRSALEALRTPGFVKYCPSSRFTGCYGAKTIMGILNDGTVKGCLSMPDPHPRSQVSHSKSLPKSLEQRYSEAAILHHKSVDKTLASCNGCANLRRCKGGCPAWTLLSDTDAQPKFCKIPASQQPFRSAAITASLANLCALPATQCQPAQVPQNATVASENDTGHDI